MWPRSDCSNDVWPRWIEVHFSGMPRVQGVTPETFFLRRSAMISGIDTSRVELWYAESPSAALLAPKMIVARQIECVGTLSL